MAIRAQELQCNVCLTQARVNSVITSKIVANHVQKGMGCSKQFAIWVFRQSCAIEDQAELPAVAEVLAGRG